MFFSIAKDSYLWYNLAPLKKTTNRVCFECGSKLILISKVTRKIEGSRFSQTVCEYRCSNSTCQAKKDKEKENRIKLIKEKEKADKKRKKDKLKTKNNIVLRRIKKK